MYSRVVAHLKLFLGIAAGPGAMLVLPWLLSPLEYGRAFGFIAIIQLLSLFSSLGLEVISARSNLPNRSIFIVLSITTLLTTIIYHQIQGGTASFYTLVLAFCVALANNIALVIQNRYLFDGDPDRYAQFGSCRAALLIVTLPACIYINIDIEASWGIASITSAAISHIAIRPSKATSDKFFSELLPPVRVFHIFHASLPMAILNSLSSLPFLIERLIAKEAFLPDIFPKYAICATLISPLVYIGNMSQNHLISHNKNIDKHAIINSTKLLILLSSGYVALLFYFAPIAYPSYFPSRADFYGFALPCILWVFGYCIFIFPLAAVMQKQAEAQVLFKCAVTSVVAVGVIYGCYEILFQQGIRLNLPWKAAVAAALVASTIVAIRGAFIWPLTKTGVAQ